jgi:signal transduction histidine kinase/DNA-binding response OmpR family regulator
LFPEVASSDNIGSECDRCLKGIVPFACGEEVSRAMSYDLFKSEKDLISRIEASLQRDERKTDVPREELEILLKGYKRLFKQTRQLVRLNDRNEESLRQAKALAQTATQAKAAFLATMSHEIRTPMTGVIGMVDMLVHTKLDDDQRQMTGTVRDSAYALLTIINDILDFSKIEAGKMELEAVPFSIRDTVEGTSETLGPNANNKGVRINIHVDPDIPDAVLGDQVRIRQILFNVGGNAVKFTEKGRVRIRALLVPTGDRKNATVRFEIIDSGIGISKEAQESLFQEFSQAESSTTRRFGGTGLGLSICQRLTEMMDGKIEVESEFGVGSKFIVTLTFPIAVKHTIKSDGHDLTGLNVLFVGDNAEERELNAKYLRHWGAKVATVGEIDEVKSRALKAAGRKKPYDLIVMGSAWRIETRADHIAAIQAEKKIATTRFVLMTETRITAERTDIANTVYVESDPLRRAPFIRAAAVAAGRASQDISYDDDEIVIEVTKAPSIEEAEAAGTLILVAEDNMTNQNVIRRQLNLLGYAVDIADDGQQALKAMKSKRYAMLLTDCHMPNMDGFELTAKIRKGEKDGDVRMPIVAITASVLAAEIDRCYEAGMDDSLPKPIEMPKLKAALRKWMPEFDPADGIEKSASTVAVADNGKDAIDPSALKRVFGDDEETFREILQEFVDPATSNLGEIEIAYADRSAGGVAKAAHKLKSSSRSVGANDLADLCETLETAGKAGDWGEIDKAAPNLAAVMRGVTDYIKAL